MNSQRVGYTINPETGKQIKIGGPTWKRLAATYYMVGDTFTDQTMPDTRAYLSRKVFGINIPDEYIAFFAPSKRGLRKREVEKHYDVIVSLSLRNARHANECVILLESASISSWEARHGTSATSSTSGMGMSSVRSDNVTYPVT